MKNNFISLFIITSNFSKGAAFLLIPLGNMLDDDYDSVVPSTLSVKINTAPESDMEIVDTPTAISQKR